MTTLKRQVLFFFSDESSVISWNCSSFYDAFHNVIVKVNVFSLFASHSTGLICMPLKDFLFKLNIHFFLSAITNL